MIHPLDWAVIVGMFAGVLGLPFLIWYEVRIIRRQRGAA